MQTDTKARRGRLWPILFMLMGSSYLLSMFYPPTSAPEQLLKAIGFFMQIPPAYFYPDGFASPSSAFRLPWHWATWLSWLGFGLVALGFLLSWL